MSIRKHKYLCTKTAGANYYAARRQILGIDLDFMQTCMSKTWQRILYVCHKFNQMRP